MLCSQVGDVRPLSMCSFSPDGKRLATASWSGLCRIWSIPDCNMIQNLRGHTAPAYSIVWHPQAGLQSDQQLALASSAQVFFNDFIIYFYDYITNFRHF